MSLEEKADVLFQLQITVDINHEIKPAVTGAQTCMG